MKYLMILLSLSLIACQKKDDASSGKALASVWTKADGTTLNFTDSLNGTMKPLGSGECRLLFGFRGDTSGLLHFYGASWAGTGADPGCSGYNEDLYFVLDKSKLTICDILKCEVYE